MNKVGLVVIVSSMAYQHRTAKEFSSLQTPKIGVSAGVYRGP